MGVLRNTGARCVESPDTGGDQIGRGCLRQLGSPLVRFVPVTAYRPRSPEATSRLMSAVRSTNNRAETLLRKRLWSAGYRYRLYGRDLPGRPDVVLPKWSTVLFVDGDFWHGRVLVEGSIDQLRSSLKTSNREWWVEKIRRTTVRDREVSCELQDRGWLVLRIWESDVLKDLEATARRLDHAIQTRSPTMGRWTRNRAGMLSDTSPVTRTDECCREG